MVLGFIPYFHGAFILIFEILENWLNLLIAVHALMQKKFNDFFLITNTSTSGYFMEFFFQTFLKMSIFYLSVLSKTCKF